MSISSAFFQQPQQHAIAFQTRTHTQTAIYIPFSTHLKLSAELQHSLLFNVQSVRVQICDECVCVQCLQNLNLYNIVPAPPQSYPCIYLCLSMLFLFFCFRLFYFISSCHKYIKSMMRMGIENRRHSTHTHTQRNKYK